jgi:flagellar M-ring protein FliF
VVDTSGKILFKRSESTSFGQMTTSQLEYQRNIEEGIKKKVQGMLEEVLGFNKAIARVSADIDFQQIDITEETYDPNAVIRSEQKNFEKSSMISNAKNVAGTKTEVQAGTKGGEEKVKPSPGKETRTRTGEPVPLQNNQAERQNEIRNYEISRVNKRIKNPVGRLKKISAAVIVDGAVKEAVDAKGKKSREYQPRSPEEMQNIEAIVKKAIGYDEARGDQVEVINMPFSWSIAEEETKAVGGEGWKEYVLLAYKPLLSLILAALFILFVARPLMKRRASPAGQGIRSLPPEGSPREALPPSTSAQIPSTPVAQPADLRQKTLQLVQDDPSKAVGIIRGWINEGKNS